MTQYQKAVDRLKASSGIPVVGNPVSADIGIGATEPIPMQITDSSAKEIFRITAEGEIESDGKIITNDDAAIGKCLREAAKVLVKWKAPESDDIDEGFE